MLKLEQVSERAKKRVIEILSDRGVSRETIRVCSMGLAADKVSNGQGFNIYNDTPEVKLKLVTDSLKEIEGHERDYTELALRIFSYAIVEEHLQGTLNDLYGR